MKNRRRGLQRIVAITVLTLIAAALGIVTSVNSKYCFTPAAISKHGFALAEVVTYPDGWTLREYVSDRPISEVKLAFVEEMKGRGYDVECTSKDERQLIGFSRAGWQKASLGSDPQDAGKTRFQILETGDFIRRARIVHGIRD